MRASLAAAAHRAFRVFVGQASLLQQEGVGLGFCVFGFILNLACE